MRTGKYQRLQNVPAALDDKAVMELLGLPPSPMVSAAVRHVQGLHRGRGPLPREAAVAELQAWVAEQDLKP